MKNALHQQEIMLVAKSGLFNHEFCEKSNSENSNLSVFEKIEQVCWSGLLKELLPELFLNDDRLNKLFLWWVCPGKSAVQVMMGEDPALGRPNYSIDPMYFLSSINFN